MYQSIVEFVSPWFETGKALWASYGVVVTTIFAILAWLRARQVDLRERRKAKLAEVHLAGSSSWSVAWLSGRMPSIPH